MNTNRGSYLLGAALGSALVLTLCVSAKAADIYQAPPEPVVEAAPAPVLDRGIYIKGYIGQANPSVGNMSNEVYDSTGIFSVQDHSIKSSTLYGLGVGWQHSHWLRFDGTIEYRGDAAFLGSDVSTFSGHERVHGRHQDLARARQRLHRHGQLVWLHAICWCGHRLRHHLSERSEGRRCCG